MNKNLQRVPRNRAVIPAYAPQILPQFQSGKMLSLLPRPGSGLILCKSHHAELVGWGSAVGGICDLDVGQVIEIGTCILVCPESHQQRKKAYLTRQKWLSLMQKVTGNSVPLRRAVGILQLVEKFFGLAVAISLPDEVLARLVGVLPKTITMARRYNPHFRWSADCGQQMTGSDKNAFNNFR